MISLVKAGMLSVLLLLTAQMLPLAFAAQQRRERKVFTNEDVASPPKAPAPESTAGEKAAPAPSPAPAGQTPETKLRGPGAELKKALEFQSAIKQAFEELSEKIETETDQFLKARWVSMADCMRILLQENQRTISELQEQIKQLESAAAPAPPQ